MSSDRVELLLREVETPVEPRPEFESALFEQLVGELEAPRRRRIGPIRRPNPRLALALAAAAVIVIVVGVVVVRPGRAAAAEVVKRATENISGLTQVRATIHYDLNPDGARPDFARGSTADVEMEYVRDVGYRQQIVRMDQPLENLGVGSLVVWDGKQLGSSWGSPRFFDARPFSGFDPLRDLSWNSPWTSWEDICARLGSEILPSSTVAGRPASHLRCGIADKVWELWIDRETGFMLKIHGELGRDDFKLGTSAQGGFEVTEIDYAFTVDPARFTMTAPPGATTVVPPLPGTLPPFRATLVASQAASGGGPAFKYRHEISYRDENAWRIDLVEDDRSTDLGPGSMIIRNGSRMVFYYGPRNTYSITASELAADPNSPAFLLSPTSRLRHLPDGSWGTASDRLRPCAPKGRETVAGRATEHLVCKIAMDPLGVLLGDFEVWLDPEATMVLKIKSSVSQWTVEVLAIEFGPTFPENTFTFTPPPGARTVEEASRDVFAITALRRGEPAPTWSGRLLDGPSFALESTRGRPTLVLFWAHWCPRTQRACDVLRQFDEISRNYSDRAAFVSVEMPAGNDDPDRTRKLMQDLDLHFPVVQDKSQDIAKSWGVERVPLWVALDRDGRVIDGAVGFQSVEQLEELLRKAGL